MNRLKQILLSTTFGFGVQALLFGLCIATSYDFRHEGPDTGIAILLTRITFWPETLLRWLDLRPPHSGASNLVILIVAVLLPIIIYSLIAYGLLRSRRTNVA
jgi:hypothetical protein